MADASSDENGTEGSFWRRESGALGRDLRVALRQLGRNRGFAATAILTLALGIGATTAIWSVVHATLLADLPVDDPDRLVTLEGSIDGEGMGGNPLRLLDLQAGATGIAKVAGFYGEQAVFRGVGGGGEPQRVRTLRIYGDVVTVLGTPPLLGRNFAPHELDPTSGVALITERFWRRELGGDPEILGRSLALNGESLAVVGVLPSSVASLLGADWVYPGPEVSNRKAGFLDLIARLDPGVSISSARVRFTEVARRMAAEYPAQDRGLGYGVVSTLAALTGTPTRGPLLMVLATAAFVLLIVCVNLACLLLARLPERMREGSIRAALGAGPWSLVRGALAESLAVSVVGGLLGILVAALGVPLLVRWLPAGLPRLDAVRLDFAAVAFALWVSGICGLAFGLLPAWQVAWRASARGLREGVRTTEGRDRRWLRASLVVGELALSLMLLVGAGLTTQALLRLRAVPLGFEPERLLAIKIARPWDTDSAELHRFYERMLAELAATPGVQSAAFVDRLPLQGASQGAELTIPGRAFANRVEVSRRAVSGGYFETVGTPRMAGSGLPETTAKNAAREVLVNESFARRFFPESFPDGAVGEEIILDGDDRYRIAGVVANLRQEAAQDVVPSEVFLHYRDTFWPLASFVVRAQRGPTELAASVRAAVRRVDPSQVIDQLQPMTIELDQTFAAPRVTAALVGGFAAVALLLAAIGLYGVLGSEVSSRRRELGIRMALGASPEAILRSAQLRGLGLAAIGVILGLGGGALLRQGMASFLYGGGAGDFAAFATAAVILLGVSVLAADGPARRASRVDPAVTLRSE